MLRRDASRSQDLLREHCDAYKLQSALGLKSLMKVKLLVMMTTIGEVCEVKLKHISDFAIFFGVLLGLIGGQVA